MFFSRGLFTLLALSLVLQQCSAQVEPLPDPVTELFVVGTFVEGENYDTDFAMTNNGDGTFSYTMSTSATASFKFRYFEGIWDHAFPPANVVYGEVCARPEDLATAIDYYCCTITVDSATQEVSGVTVTCAEDPGVNPCVAKTESTMYIRGNYWSTWNDDIPLAPSGDGLFVGIVEADKSTEFKFRPQLGLSYDCSYPASGNFFWKDECLNEAVEDDLEPYCCELTFNAWENTLTAVALETCLPRPTDLVYSHADSVGDTWGPFPSGEMDEYDDAHEVTDIVDFKVFTGLDSSGEHTTVRFDVTFNAMSNVYGSLLDFSLPSIHIYVDTDRVEGSGRTTLVGDNGLKLDPLHAWEYATIVDGFNPVLLHASRYPNVNEFGDVTFSGSRISSNNVQVELNTVSVFFSLLPFHDDLNLNPDDWAYTVFVGIKGEEEDILGSFAPRRPINGPHSLGGANSDQWWDSPSAVDVLSPDGRTDDEFLGKECRDPMITAVGPGIEANSRGGCSEATLVLSQEDAADDVWGPLPSGEADKPVGANTGDLRDFQMYEEADGSLKIKVRLEAIYLQEIVEIVIHDKNAISANAGVFNVSSVAHNGNAFVNEWISTVSIMTSKDMFTKIERNGFSPGVKVSVVTPDAEKHDVLIDKVAMNVVNGVFVLYVTPEDLGIDTDVIPVANWEYTVFSGLYNDFNNFGSFHPNYRTRQPGDASVWFLGDGVQGESFVPNVLDIIIESDVTIQPFFLSPDCPDQKLRFPSFPSANFQPYDHACFFPASKQLSTNPTSYAVAGYKLMVDFQTSQQHSSNDFIAIVDSDGCPKDGLTANVGKNPSGFVLLDAQEAGDIEVKYFARVPEAALGDTTCDYQGVESHFLTSETLSVFIYETAPALGGAGGNSIVFDPRPLDSQELAYKMMLDINLRDEFNVHRSAAFTKGACEEGGCCTINGAFTFEVWIKPFPKSEQSEPTKGCCWEVFDIGDDFIVNIVDGGALEITLPSTGGEMCGTQVIQRGDISSTKTLFDPVWHHIAVSASNTQQKIFVDGKEVHSGDCDGSFPTFNAKSIRLATGRGKFEGYMDELRVWTKVRTKAEIEDSMHRVLRDDELGQLLMYYNFDEILVDDAGDLVIPDLSTNPKDLKLGLNLQDYAEGIDIQSRKIPFLVESSAPISGGSTVVTVNQVTAFNDESVLVGLIENVEGIVSLEVLSLPDPDLCTVMTRSGDAIEVGDQLSPTSKVKVMTKEGVEEFTSTLVYRVKTVSSVASPSSNVEIKLKKKKPPIAGSAGSMIHCDSEQKEFAFAENLKLPYADEIGTGAYTIEVMAYCCLLAVQICFKV